MAYQKNWQSENGMSSVDLAHDYARRLIATEARGPGDLEPAMSRLEAKTGIGFHTLRNLWYGRRKLIDQDLFLRIRGAYLALCERQVAALQHDLLIEQAKGSGDDSLESLGREAVALVEKIAAARARLKDGLEPGE